MRIGHGSALVAIAATCGCSSQGVPAQLDAAQHDDDAAQVAPNCAIAVPGTSIAIGATPTLSALCDRGTPPFSYQWHKATTAITNATSANYTLRADADTATAGTTSYAVTVSNGTGTMTASAAVVVAPRATTMCSPDARLYSLDLNASSVIGLIDSSGQVGTTPVVIELTVGSAAQFSTMGRTETNLPKVWYFERPSSPQAAKQVTLATSPCNFDNPEYVLLNGRQGGWTSVVVNDPRTTTLPKISAGRWYLNIRNLVGSCDPSTACDTTVQWNP